MNKPNHSLLFFLGRRVERLIFIGILLILLCFVQAYLTTANKYIVMENPKFTQNILLRELELRKELLELLYEADRHENYYEINRNKIEKAKDELNNKIESIYSDLSFLSPRYIGFNKNKLLIPKDIKITYKEFLKKIEFSLVGLPNVEWRILGNHLTHQQSPETLIDNLKKNLLAEDTTAPTVWGTKLPRKLHLNYANQGFELSYQLIASLSTIAISFLNIGWLSTLLITRSRELSIINKLDSQQMTFPHLLNCYDVSINVRNAPTLTMKQLIKANKFSKKYALFYRISIILIITLPILGGFAYSLLQFTDIEWVSEVFNPLYIGYSAALISTILILILVLLECEINKKIFYE